MATDARMNILFLHPWPWFFSKCGTYPMKQVFNAFFCIPLLVLLLSPYIPPCPLS